MGTVGWGILTGAALIIYYVSSCVFWPYTRCLFCKGQARRPAWWGGGFRMCGWCGGNGRRLRFGRWTFNKLLRITKESR